MKKTFSLIFLIVLINNFTHAQVLFPMDSASGEIVYTEILFADSLNKHALFNKGGEWFAHLFVSANNVIQFSDSVAGKIIGKGHFKSYFHTLGVHDAGNIRFTIELSFKDFKYKYVISDIRHESGFTDLNTPGDLRIQKQSLLKKSVWNEIRTDANINILALISSLKNYMREYKSEW